MGPVLAEMVRVVESSGKHCFHEGCPPLKPFFPQDRALSTGARLARWVIGCYSQQVATWCCNEIAQPVAIGSGLCYSQEVGNKAVGLPVAVVATPSANDAKSVRPSSEAEFVGLKEAISSLWPLKEIPQRTYPPQDPGNTFPCASVAQAILVDH